jgi:uncharacterized protein
VTPVTPEPPFLEAEWRSLVMLNYPIDPSILADLLPAGCESDAWQGRTFVSVVGFRFLRTRVLGIAVPFHRDFEEVNLRCYVRRKEEGQWRRGVVFVKELVPRPAIAFLARRIYGENYVALPMRHAIERDGTGGAMTVSYQWRRGARWEGLSARTSGAPSTPAEDSEETFITEHYWGYTRQPDRSTIEYQVEHPRWRVWRATDAALSCDVATLYGSRFVEALAGSPSTAFVAEGSPVVVRGGRRLADTVSGRP